jgi:glycosyltransferase involved in cell wall biosynthesis
LTEPTENRRRLAIAGVDPELAFGGGEVQVMGLTKGLIRRGHRAELICDPRGKLWEKARAQGIVCHPLAIRNSIDFPAALRLRSILRAGNFDVVHFHTSRAHAMAPIVRGAARVAVVTRRMDYAPNRMFAPMLYNRAVDAVAAISNAVAQALAGAGVNRAAISVIPSGFDMEFFRPPTPNERTAARAKYLGSEDRFFVAAIGALHERKGHRHLLEAIALTAKRATTPMRCVIAGEGAMRPALEALVRDLEIGDAVALAGQVADVRELIWAADVVAMPSLAEGLGVAVLEAMACGVAVVASAVGGLCESVADGATGIMVPVADPEAIADALVRLANEPGLRAAMGAAARKRAVELFSMDAMTAATEAMYLRALAALNSGKR